MTEPALLAVPLTARPTGPRVCTCVKTHTPVMGPDEAEGHHVWPLGEGGPDKAANMRWLCGTTHNSVHALWRLYQRHGGTPPADLVRRYRPYVRDIVADGWAQAHPATEGGTTT